MQTPNLGLDEIQIYNSEDIGLGVFAAYLSRDQYHLVNGHWLTFDRPYLNNCDLI